MDIFLSAVMTVLEPSSLLILFLATVTGMMLGAIPGLTVVMAIALAVPMTLWMDTVPAMMLLIGLYGSGTYSGSISACLINAPGTPASAATALDGYPMAQQGRPLKALRLALWASIFGGLVSIVLLVLIAPQLAQVALKFGPAELASLLIFSLTLIGILSGGSMAKGLLAAALGMLIATVGADPMLSVPRFTFGYTELWDGFSFIPVLIGLFAIAELFEQGMKRFKGNDNAINLSHTDKEMNRITKEDVRKCTGPAIRSSLIGSFIGALPGLSASVAAFLSYAVTKRLSKTPEELGKGSAEGIVSSESANNAVTGSAMIPLLALAIPGDPPTAILLGALLVQGVTPGPMIFTSNPEIVYSIYIILFVALVFLGVVASFAIKPITHVLRVPTNILFPIILVMCVAGSYSIRSNIFDVYVMFGAGILGYMLRLFSVPIAPLLIAFILTKPFEEALRQALITSDGGLMIFIEKPISAIFLILAALMVASVALRAKNPVGDTR